MAKKPTLDSIDASLARWKTRLKRAVSTIDKLEKQRRRLDAKLLRESLIADIKAESKPEPKPAKAPWIVGDNVKGFEPVIEPAPTPLHDKTASAPAPADDLGIPSFLQRTPDPVASQIREEQAETKRKKARGRIEKMKAKKAGELKKMPLSGKAALEHIRNG